ncbi:unnamed protein product [Urochloa decumbens]|uniref:Cytochrome P450 n=1 Tax=Urochloa decumbens TaxID=240449 RepID=A0ABC9GC78_9POAL
MDQIVLVLFLFLFPILVALLLLLRFVTVIRTRRSSSGNGNSGGLPPSPPGQLPIIGHLHLVMVGSHPPHVSLREIAARHGGLVLLRLGQVPNLVVSSPRAAEVVLRAHDHAFASRPPSAAADILVGGAAGPYDVAWAPYGDYWRQARKLVAAHLPSARKVHSLRRARQEEVRRALAMVVAAAAASCAVDVAEVVGAFVNDVVCAAVSGRSLLFRHAGRNRRVLRELILDNTRLLGGFNSICDYFPIVAMLLTPIYMLCAGTTTRLKNRWDVLLDQTIDEHVMAAKPLHEDHNNQQEEDSRDFIDVLLSLQQEYCLTRHQVKAILMDMFVAGTDTSSVALEYAMAELIKNPHVMTKLQAEITSNTLKGQEMVTEEDLDNMTYLKAVVKETLRLHPPTPLMLPRISLDKCDVNGYTIPAGTRVIVNAWALGRDPKSWDKADEFMPENAWALGRDPKSWDKADEFMPERFIHCGNTSSSVDDFKGRDFKFLPFGAGRRICPGINFGVVTVEIMLANLLYCFDWDLPTGMNREDIDMTEVFGLTVRLKEKLLLVPRSLRNVDHT